MIIAFDSSMYDSQRSRYLLTSTSPCFGFVRYCMYSCRILRPENRNVSGSFRPINISSYFLPWTLSVLFILDIICPYMLFAKCLNELKTTGIPRVPQIYFCPETQHTIDLIVSAVVAIICLFL